MDCVLSEHVMALHAGTKRFAIWQYFNIFISKLLIQKITCTKFKISSVIVMWLLTYKFRYQTGAYRMSLSPPSSHTDLLGKVMLAGHRADHIILTYTWKQVNSDSSALLTIRSKRVIYSVIVINTILWTKCMWMCY